MADSDCDESKFIPDYEEEVLPNPIHGSTSKSGKKCPACPGKFTHVRRHVLREHLPWYSVPSSACWECQLNFGCENSLRNHIKLQHNNNPLDRQFNFDQHFTNLCSNFDNLLSKFNFEQLLGFINSENSFTICKGSVWQNEDLQIIELYLSQKNYKFAESLRPYPAESICSIFHWKILSILLSHENTPLNVPPTVQKKLHIVGSSIIYWAQKRAEETDYLQLGLEKHTDISWRGIRGMKWRQLIPLIKEIPSDTDVIVIHLGSNDISYCLPKKLASLMKQDLMKCFEIFPNSTFIFSHLLSRQTWRFITRMEGEKRKNFVNWEVSKFVSERGGHCIPHEQIRSNCCDLFRRDGVHLTNKGNDIFIQDLIEFLKSYL